LSLLPEKGYRKTVSQHSKVCSLSIIHHSHVLSHVVIVRPLLLNFETDASSVMTLRILYQNVKQQPQSYTACRWYFYGSSEENISLFAKLWSL